MLFDQDICINYCLSESMDLTTANTNDNVSRSSEPNKEVKDDSFMGEEDEYTIGDRGVKFPPNPAQGTGACGEELIN